MSSHSGHPLTRRRFVQGVAGSALLLGAGARRVWSASATDTSGGAILKGPQFQLTIDELAVNFTGATRMATAVNGRVPAPLLRMRQGELVTVRVTNRLPVTSSIHWHGMIVPADMDGVPGLSFAGIAPGATFTYRFRVNQSGTYWYHAHSRFQEQTGLYGPIVVERAAGERFAADREYTILLSDWSDADPEHLYATLKRDSEYFNHGRRTAMDFAAAARAQGVKRALADWGMWGRMRMDPTDLADVSGATYTYLMNGTTPAANWTALFARGERVRLRFINGSAMSFFDVRIPDLPMTVVAADGQDVEPVTIDEFRIGTAEVLDVIVTPQADRSYTIFAQSMDRSGFARGTLSPAVGMNAAVPALDPRPVLTMADMGMAMSGMNAKDGMADMPGMDMSSMPGMSHGDMSDMDHGEMNHGAMDHSTMDHSATGHGATGNASPPQHARAEYGPTVDMLATHPAARLDDPGVGLRDNGRRVLTYANLHTLGGPIDRREPGRDVELHLTGHMERYIWSFSGQKFSEAEPLRFAHGERLRIVLVNDSMMTHPIHLHGMWSELEAGDGSFLVRKHTVSVQPGQRLSYQVTADALGRWAYHCHLLYHMEAGMFREVVVAHGGAAMPEHHS